MRRIFFNSLLFLFLAQVCALAQLDSSTGGYVTAPSTSQVMDDSAINNPQWQINLGVIKDKAQRMMEKNNNLMAEKKSLIKETENLQNQIREWQIKNQTLKDPLKEKHGRTNQQKQIDELTVQLNDKKAITTRLQQDLVRVQKKAADFHNDQQKSREALLKSQRSQKNKGLRKHPEDQKDQELERLNKQLQEQKSQERIFTTKLEDLKKEKVLPQVTELDNDQVKELQARAEELRKEKEELENKVNAHKDQAKVNRYKRLSIKKEELENRIRRLEQQLSNIKDGGSFDFLESRKKKQKLHQMIQLDNRNIKLRQRIANLREDIVVLKEQVVRLEHKAKFLGSTK